MLSGSGKVWTRITPKPVGSDVGRGDKRYVINSWDSGAADLEVYVRDTDVSLIGHDWLMSRTNEPVFPRVTSPVLWIESPGVAEGRRGCGWRGAIAAHLSDRARKHEHQAKAKNEFADDFCFHVIYFPFVVLAFFDFSSLRTHFWPFTERTAGNPARYNAEKFGFLRNPAFSHRGTFGVAGCGSPTFASRATAGRHRMSQIVNHLRDYPRNTEIKCAVHPRPSELKKSLGVMTPSFAMISTRARRGIKKELFSASSASEA